MLSKEYTKRIFKNSAFLTLLSVTGTLIFTKSIIYCIIIFVAAFLSAAGFWILIKTVDRCLDRGGKGQTFHFAATFLKFLVISVFFYFISRISQQAVLYYILGLSVTVLSLVWEGIIQAFRSYKDGRN